MQHPYIQGQLLEAIYNSDLGNDFQLFRLADFTWLLVRVMSVSMGCVLGSMDAQVDGGVLTCSDDTDNVNAPLLFSSPMCMKAKKHRGQKTHLFVIFSKLHRTIQAITNCMDFGIINLTRTWGANNKS